MRTAARRASAWRACRSPSCRCRSPTRRLRTSTGWPSGRSTRSAGLTRPVEAPKAVERPPLDERLRYDGDDLLDAWGRMQADFLVRGWADGFPLVPPTERAVGALLRSTRRGPGDVIATLEPGFGIATVEKLAINAVMAGCGPQHPPLPIAAVRCLAEPKMYIRNKAMSTGPHAPLVLVNGPKGRAASLNSG